MPFQNLTVKLQLDAKEKRSRFYMSVLKNIMHKFIANSRLPTSKAKNEMKRVLGRESVVDTCG